MKNVTLFAALAIVLFITSCSKSGIKYCYMIKNKTNHNIEMTYVTLDKNKQFNDSTVNFPLFKNGSVTIYSNTEINKNGGENIEAGNQQISALRYLKIDNNGKNINLSNLKKMENWIYAKIDHKTVYYVLTITEDMMPKDSLATN
jgi:hypothetical protein